MSSPRFRIDQPWKAIRRWLVDVPVDDPVDRRNAPMLQLILLLVAVPVPLLWAYRVFGSDVPWRSGETLAVSLSMAFCGFAAFSFYLVRRGRMQWALWQLMVVVALSVIASHVGSGFGGNRFEQPVNAVWLVMAGLMIGRRALWIMCAAILSAFALGVHFDVGQGEQLDGIVVDAIVSGLIFVLIALAVDRTASALRESLAAATLRSNELAHANQRLQAEIIEREQVQEQLIHARKIEMVGRLSSGIAHDFNHLLGLVQGYAGRGLEASEPATMREALLGVDGVSRRAAQVANRLLDFSRADVRLLKDIDVAAALEELQPMLRQLLAPGIGIELQLSDAPVMARLDPAQFDLMVLNIASNAGDAMPDGGHFTIDVRGGEDQVHIRFSDTGMGMTEQVRSHLLEPFFTTKPRGEGTGLGLAVVAAMIGDAGGAIYVTSAPGEGTEVRIQLPMAAVSRTPAAADVRAGSTRLPGISPALG